MALQALSESTQSPLWPLPPRFSRPRSSLNISVTAHDLAPGTWIDQSQDATLPLQPISASHRANHHANAATSSADKGELPIPCTDQQSPAKPELSSENVAPDVVETVVEMPDAEGCPLQRYPNATEAEVDISGDDGRTSRAGQYRYHDVDACFDVRGLFPQNPHVLDAEDERKMVTEYIHYMEAGEVWPSTKVCGTTPLPRGHIMAFTLHETLLTNMFAAAVNGAWTAMGGPPCYRVDAIYVCEYHPPPVGVRIAEEGTLHALRNVQHSRALPFHYYPYNWLRELAQAYASPPVPVVGEGEDEDEEPLIFVGDEVVEGEFGEPEAAEWDGECDETETF